VEVLTPLPVERYATREVLEDVHDEMARAKKVAEDIECLGEMILMMI